MLKFLHTHKTLEGASMPTTTPSRQNKPPETTQQIEQHLDDISRSVVRIDAFLFDAGDASEAMRHARSIENCAKRIVKLLGR